MQGEKTNPYTPLTFSLIHATINCMDIVIGKITQLYQVDKGQPEGLSGLSVAPGGEGFIYPQLDQENTRIMTVENFRW